MTNNDSPKEPDLPVAASAKVYEEPSTGDLRTQFIDEDNPAAPISHEDEFVKKSDAEEAISEKAKLMEYKGVDYARKIAKHCADINEFQSMICEKAEELREDLESSNQGSFQSVEEAIAEARRNERQRILDKIEDEIESTKQAAENAGVEVHDLHGYTAITALKELRDDLQKEVKQQ